jgi:PTH1 family peptidyl-tRNA hydrolase
MDDAAPWLVVGLGNPGAKYAEHRHNIGFMVTSAWVDQNLAPGVPDPWRDKFNGRLAALTTSAGRCVVLQPQTYMNRSGKAVQAAKAFYRVPDRQIIVVHDELDFEFGRVAVKAGGGHGGHNGLRDIIAVTGSRDFVRVRVGIGRPPKGPMDVADWVLSNFSESDRADLPDVVDRASAALSAVITDGLSKAMNRFNKIAAKEPPSGNKADPEPTAESE